MVLPVPGSPAITETEPRGNPPPRIRRRCRCSLGPPVYSCPSSAFRRLYERDATLPKARLPFEPLDDDRSRQPSQEHAQLLREGTKHPQGVRVGGASPALGYLIPYCGSRSPSAAPGLGRQTLHQSGAPEPARPRVLSEPAPRGCGGSLHGQAPAVQRFYGRSWAVPGSETAPGPGRSPALSTVLLKVGPMQKMLTSVEAWPSPLVRSPAGAPVSAIVLAVLDENAPGIFCWQSGHVPLPSV